MSQVIRTIKTGTELHVITYLKGDITAPDVIYVTIPELGAAISVIQPMMRKVLMSHNNVDELMCRFITHSVDVQLREEDTHEPAPGVPVTMARLGTLFLSDVGPVDQTIISQCKISGLSVIGATYDAQVISYPDAVYAAPTTDELVAQLDGDKLLGFLATLLSSGDDERPGSVSGDVDNEAATPHVLH